MKSVKDFKKSFPLSRYLERKFLSLDVLSMYFQSSYGFCCHRVMMIEVYWGQKTSNHLRDNIYMSWSLTQVRAEAFHWHCPLHGFHRSGWRRREGCGLCILDFESCEVLYCFFFDWRYVSQGQSVASLKRQRGWPQDPNISIGTTS